MNSNASSPLASQAVAPVFWLTGLSGAGKSTLAEGASQHLFASGIKCILIDGDVLRAGLSSDLGFTAEDRAENVRRAAEIASLCANASIVTFVSLVSPFEVDRKRARQIVGDKFHEIFVDASFPVCSERDVKGLYKRAAEGKIPHFTGLDSPYERPRSAELVIDTMANDLKTCVDMLVNYAYQNGVGDRIHP
ncbi:adenylyl-sulfate kinase [Pararobbsia alpina]|uniref:Adenylyl-sulfate kinase n=1 Tax=Pararobbsia alpina TaxID=621374 RepID=A0A6S7B1B2_9BURK|nr:adenylyl-sulfate kinase [Pararobbsia alpina]CAB3782057.1 putative adenylyl-sulfate kinase [Pararobbsia alpina]